MDKSNTIKLGVAALALVAALCIWMAGGGGDEELPGKFFYDLSEAERYEAPRDAFAPLDGIGGESGDGVEAITVRCPQCGVGKERIAYLKSHTPDYKQKREAAKSAGIGIKDLTRKWIAENTLIRALEGDTWHVATSEEAMTIVSGWKRRCIEHGVNEKPLRP